MAYFVYVEPSQRSMRKIGNFFVRRGEATPLYFVYSKELQRSMAEKFYQEALRTPGISPL